MGLYEGQWVSPTLRLQSNDVQICVAHEQTVPLIATLLILVLTFTIARCIYMYMQGAYMHGQELLTNVNMFSTDSSASAWS